MKAKKSYKRGGMMEPIIGMPKSKKLEKLKPIGVSKITTGEMMSAASDKARKLKDPSLRKTVAEVEKPRRKKRRKFEMGGTLSAPNVNLRGEGKKKKKTKTRGGGDMLATTARPERMEKIAPKGPDVIGLAKKVKPGTIKKSSAKIPVPAKKRRRKFENGGKTNKDSVRTDTLERSVDQVYANARREEEERANSNRNNSGTTSGYRNVGRPLTTARPGAPAKVKPLGPKKISSGVSMDKTLKKSTAKISAPAEKKRKRKLRRRK